MAPVEARGAMAPPALLTPKLCSIGWIATVTVNYPRRSSWPCTAICGEWAQRVRREGHVPAATKTTDPAPREASFVVAAVEGRASEVPDLTVTTTDNRGAQSVSPATHSVQSLGSVPSASFSLSLAAAAKVARQTCCDGCAGRKACRRFAPPGANKYNGLRNLSVVVPLLPRRRLMPFACTPIMP